MANKAHKSPKVNRQANRMLADLEEYYELGKKVRAADKENMKNRKGKKKYSLGVVHDIAEEVGASREFVEKARLFACCYTETEFQQLCKLRNAEGKPLGLSQVRRLLSVGTKKDRLERKKDRRKWQSSAVKNGWTLRQLNSMLGRKGKRSSGGRALKTPPTTRDAFQQLIGQSEAWLKRYDNAWFGGEELILSRGAAKHSPTKLRTTATEVLERLERAARKARRELGKRPVKKSRKRWTRRK